MQYSAQLYPFYILLSSVCVSLAAVGSNFNLTRFRMYREKRSLIFEGGGQIKFIIGPTLPVNLGDPITWRSLIGSINLHGGHYAVPTEPLYPWDKYENIFARSMRKLRFDGDLRSNKKALEEAAALQYWTDDSRLFVYTALETFFNRENGSANGRACLLRSICENAQVQQHIGIFAEVLNIILTPGKQEIDSAYKAAFEAGKSGVVCLQVYADCPMGSNILDAYLEFF